MAEAQDTVPTGTETGNQVIGTQAVDSAAGSDTGKPTEPEVNPRLAELEKELNKAKIRANQLENERETARQAALEEQGKWQEIAEERARKLEEREAADAEAQRVADSRKLRDSAIEELTDERLKAIGRELVKQNPDNLFWNGNVDSEEAAKAEVKRQLEALGSAVGVMPQNNDVDSSTSVNANNPLPQREVPTTRTGKFDIEAAKKQNAEIAERLKNFSF